MSCTDDKFTITKGLNNTFIFTIKADGETTPMAIVGGETFTAQLVKLSDSTTVLTKTLSVEDALNGQVKLLITSSDTSSLVIDKGDKTDRYYLRPVYKLVIECRNTGNGDFIAKVPEVYVD